DHIGVLDGGGGLRFTKEPAPLLDGLLGACLDDLEGDLPARVLVSSGVDRAHPPLADQPLDDVSPGDDIALCEGGRRRHGITLPQAWRRRVAVDASLRVSTLTFWGLGDDDEGPASSCGLLLGTDAVLAIRDRRRANRSGDRTCGGV